MQVHNKIFKFKVHIHMHLSSVAAVIVFMLLCTLQSAGHSSCKKEGIMSSSKGSKRISVFDRLGPGNDDVSLLNSATIFIWIQLQFSKILSLHYCSNPMLATVATAVVVRSTRLVLVRSLVTHMGPLHHPI